MLLIITSALCFFFLVGMFVYALNAPLSEDYYKRGTIDENIRTLKATYHGGFDDVSVVENPQINILVNDDNIEIFFTKYERLFDIKKKIDSRNIKKVRFMNERSISEELSLGKLVCFGWLGLAMKKKRDIVSEYIVIDIDVDGTQSAIVIQPRDCKGSEIQKEINKILKSGDTV